MPLTVCTVLCLLSSLTAGVTSRTVTVSGAGASFPNEVYKSWMTSYTAVRAQFRDVNLTYESVGSGTGRTWIQDESRGLEYAGSDSLMSEEEHIEYPDLHMFPTIAGAVVMTYNLPGVDQLILDPETIVGIYNGTFTTWDDPTIRRLNPAVAMPAERIVVLARADKSGTTEIFTKALSRFSSQWRSRFGVFSKGVDRDYQPYYWDSSAVTFFGDTNRGMSGLTLSLRYSIGYISVADAKAARVPYAKVKNRAGQVIEVSTTSIQSAMDDFADAFTADFTVDIIDGPGTFSYPIAGYTYFIIHMTGMEDCDTATELWRYIDWFISDSTAASVTEQLDFVPLTEKIVDRINSRILANMTCGAESANVRELAEKQKADEIRDTEVVWKVVRIVVPIVTVIIVICSGYFIWIQIKINKALLKNEWKISVKRLRRITGIADFRSHVSIGHSVRSFKQSRASNLTGNSALLIGLNEGVLDNKHAVYTLRLKLSNTRILRMRTRRRLLWMRDMINHINVTKFIGLFEDDGDVYGVTSLCRKGRLTDVLQNEQYKLDVNFKCSIALDIASGMHYLKKQGIIHGNLSSHTCYIDERWNVKVEAWYLNDVAYLENDIEIGAIPLGESLETDADIIARTQFWTAPERLRNPELPATKEGDVYSFAILLVEIFHREDPFSDYDMMTPKEIIEAIKQQGIRPKIGPDVPPLIKDAITEGWSSVFLARPTFAKLKTMIRQAKPSKKSVLDCMMEEIEGYVARLEEKVAERTSELEAAVSKSTDLLHKMLPASVARMLSEGQSVQPEYFESVTIFFSDIVGFTPLSSQSTPMEVITMLNDLYTVFDSVLDRHDVYKVETIGDAYMVISGVPVSNGNAHASHIVSMAIDMAVASDQFVIRHRPNKKLELRVGIHSGPVCTGVVGVKMPRYTVFGDTVNTASRMESSSLSMKIQVSETTKAILDVIGGFSLEKRGMLNVKGKGLMQTFWLLGKVPSEVPMPASFLRTIAE